MATLSGWKWGKTGIARFPWRLRFSFVPQARMVKCELADEKGSTPTRLDRRL